MKTITFLLPCTNPYWIANLQKVMDSAKFIYDLYLTILSINLKLCETI